MARKWLQRGLIALGLVLLVVICLRNLPVSELMIGLVTWIEGLGIWGPLILALAYIPASLLLIPGSLMTLGAGFVFGLLVGTLTVSLGSTLAAAAAFWAGRTFARPWVEKKIASMPRFRALDEAVGQAGFKIVLLTRLSPLFPFTLLNYAYGLTRVSFRDYLLASWIGMLPGTVLYVYLGTAARQVSDQFTGQIPETGGPYFSLQRAFFFLGLVLTLVATIYITRLARRALNKSLPPADPQPINDP